MAPKEIEIMRVGEFTANNGTTHNFSSDALHQIAESYNPQNFRAPLIVSHDTQGVPDKDIVSSQLAFGFPKKLEVVGDRLKAKFDKISPQFVQWVRDGNLLSVSSSLYMPDSPANPYPGKWSLRHIAGLGSDPPAIKGMTPLELQEMGAIAFDDSSAEGALDFDQGSIDFGHGNYALMTIMRSLREWFIDQYSTEDADRIIPSMLLEDLAFSSDCHCDPVALQEALSALPSIDFQGGDMPGHSKKDKDERKPDAAVVAVVDDEDEDEETDMSEETVNAIAPQDTPEFKELQKQLQLARLEAAQAKEQARRNEIASFCQHLTPAQTGSIEVSFGEATEEVTLADHLISLDERGYEFMKGFIKGLPSLVELGEVVKGDDVTVDLNEMDSASLANKVNQYANEHNLSFAEAYREVGRQYAQSV